jgi:hypothetical protein
LSRPPIIRIYRVRRQDLTRMRREFFRCIQCSRRMLLGDWVVSKRTGNTKRSYYCKECAKRFRLIEE